MKINNRFDVLEIEPCNEILQIEETKQIQKKFPSKWKNDSLKRNGFVIDHKPETNVNPFQNIQKIKKTVPGNSSYAKTVANVRSVISAKKCTPTRINL